VRELRLIPVYFPEKLIDDVDERWKKEGYASRAEYIRRAVREKVEKNEVS